MASSSSSSSSSCVGSSTDKASACSFKAGRWCWQGEFLHLHVCWHASSQVNKMSTMKSPNPRLCTVVVVMLLHRKCARFRWLPSPPQC
jgi:hypothetical protein